MGLVRETARLETGRGMGYCRGKGKTLCFTGVVNRVYNLIILTGPPDELSNSSFQVNGEGAILERI